MRLLIDTNISVLSESSKTKIMKWYKPVLTLLAILAMFYGLCLFLGIPFPMLLASPIPVLPYGIVCCMGARKLCNNT